MIRAGDVVTGAYGDAGQAPVDPADIAAVAAVALTDPGFARGALHLTGPAALTSRAQLAVLSDVLGRSLRWQELTPEQFRARLAAQNVPLPLIDSIVGLQARAVAEPPQIASTVQEVTGREPRTFAGWARDHVRDFR